MPVILTSYFPFSTLVTELPPLDTPVAGGDLAFHYHSGGHMAVPADWKTFLDFADRHIRTPEAKSP